MIKLVASERDARVIEGCVLRWKRITGQRNNLLEVEMDITATHLNGCPLKLVDLLQSPEADFCHDISGIKAHMNRGTGQLEDNFRPRYAK